MTAARHEPAPQPQQPMHVAAQPARQTEAAPPATATHTPARDEHAEEPGYGHGV
jgi:hypothetical protein